MHGQRSFLALLLLLVCVPAQSRAAALPPQIQLGDQQLLLNGQGVRSKYLLSLYTAGLYLKAPEKNSLAIIAGDAPMMIRIVITSKFVTQEKLVESLQQGFQQSTDGKLEPLQAAIQQFRHCFAGDIASGDVFDLIHVPGQGVAVLKNGNRQGVIAGLPFKQALFGIWLGDRPVDPKLRQALLSSAQRR
jgi:hypothetical protein